MVDGRAKPHALRHGIARPGPDDTAARRRRRRRLRPASPTEPSSAAGPAAGDPPPATPTGGTAEGPRRLYRSRDERVVGGVCGGLAEYFGIDPLIVRIIAVALVFAGGAGFLAYLAAWLLVPDADGASSRTATAALATIAGTVLLVLAVGTVLPFWHGPFGGWGWGGPLVSLICLGLAGLAVWWVASGEHPAASGTRDILRRAGFGVALLAVCGLLALGGAWATAAGGGVIVAAVVIVAGLWLVAGAFLGGARWLILPALALALPAGRRRRPRTSTSTAASATASTGRRRPPRSAARTARRRPPRRRPARHEAAARRPPASTSRSASGAVVARRAAQRVRDEQGARRRRPGQRVRPRLRRPRRRLARRPRRRAAGTPRLIVDGDVGVGVLDVTYDDPDDHFDRRRSVADRDARQRGVHRGRPWLGATWTSPRSSRASPSSCSASCCCSTASTC